MVHHSKILRVEACSSPVEEVQAVIKTQNDIAGRDIQVAQAEWHDFHVDLFVVVSCQSLVEG
jgi:hypothetical protein